MPEFTDEKIRRTGAPRVPIPPEIGEWAEMTYTSGKACEIEARDDEDSALFLRLLRIYANRQHKSVDHQFTSRAGTSYLRFRMRDRRRYDMSAREKTTP